MADQKTNDRPSLRAVCERLGIKATATYDNVIPYEKRDQWQREANPWTVKLVRRVGGRRRTLTASFFTGPAITRELSAADVLSCLISDCFAGEQSFEEFCSDMGYDADSRTAERTWKLCASMAPRVRRFLGDDFETVAGAEH